MTTNTKKEMKKLIITIMIFLPILGIGQTTTENYIKNTSYRVETQDGNVSATDQQENITYHDGLGRPKQSIAVRAGGQRQNIVTYTEYDDFGRTPREYLPYATDAEVANPLDFMSQTALKNAIHQFYDTSKYEDTQNPYSEMVYEPSLLNRVLKQGAPGNSWAVGPNDNDHTIKSEYRINTINEVRFFDVSFVGGDTENPALILNGYYGEGQLNKAITKDENWTPTSGNNHTTEEFTNKSGQIILKRTYNNNTAHDTYYIYDNYENLTYVLSPEGSNQIVSGTVLVSNYQEILNKLCYQYTYDYRNRLIEKRVPGKGIEYILYDNSDRPVLTQDARLRENYQYLFTKYDDFNRVVYTGIYTSSSSRQTIQNQIDTQTELNEDVTDNSNSFNGNTLYYTNQVFPTLSTSVLTVNYYDTYRDHEGINLPTQVYNQNLTNQTQELPTVSKVRVLGTDHWITSVIGYDGKARPIYTVNENTYLNTNNTFSALLDFTGNILESITTHLKGDKGAPGAIPVTTRDYFTYDHQNRLLSHKQKVDDEPLQLITSNTYDELGQLVSKDVGGETTFDGYTDMVKVTIDQDGNVEKLADNTSDNGWDAKLKTKGEIKGNGGVSFTTPFDAFRYYRVGLVNTDSNNEDDRYFDYGIYIKAGDDNNDGFSDVNIILNSITPITTYIGSYQAGDTFKVERRNNEILFKKNNSTFYSTTINDYETFVGKASLFSYNAKINDLTLFGDFIDKKLQKVDYEYNVRGWLTDINPIDASSFSRGTDLFQFHINYDQPLEGNAAGIPLYNGNISQTIWKTANTDTQKRGYGYTYDALNRIEAAYSKKGNTLTANDNFNVFDIGYDKNGNIQDLKRNSTNEYGLASRMDDLIYSYDGNQLLSVSESALTTIKDDGFFDGNTIGDDYQYDINGNMIEDKNKGIESITYNHLNLPDIVTINTTDAEGVLQQGTISYIYDATGVKLAKIVNDVNQNTTVTTCYAEGGYIYEDDQLKMFPHSEGYIEPIYNTTKSIQKFNKTTQTVSFSGYQYAFNYTDHLGNVRLTYADSDGNGSIRPSTEIISEKHYYPFGLQQKGYNDVVTSNVNSVANRFKFNGMEENDELGLNSYDFGARNYDASIGRWMNIDPLTELMRDQSPYNFAFNNPVYFFDYDGQIPLPQIVNFSRISSTFGLRMHPIQKKLKGHSGVDLAVANGAVVSAAARGTVAKIGWDPDGYGRYVIIKHADGYYSLYAHLLEDGVNVQKNQTVGNGEAIGHSGNTGGSTGPHLHFEIIKANSISEVFKKENKVNPQSIYDLDQKLHGVSINSVEDVDNYLELASTKLDLMKVLVESAENDPLPQVSPVGTVTPESIAPTNTPLPSPGGGSVQPISPAPQPDPSGTITPPDPIIRT